MEGGVAVDEDPGIEVHSAGGQNRPPGLDHFLLNLGGGDFFHGGVFPLCAARSQSRREWTGGFSAASCLAAFRP